jgi:cysteinyl-tRNA synthetase
MFVCGPTVQDHLHVGHAKTYTAYDLLARLLTHLGYSVTFVMNITDVDDKIFYGAKASGKSISEYVKFYTSSFLEDMKRLGVHTVTSYEKASDYVDIMVEQVRTLIKNGHAYVSGSNVYFDVNSFPSYGRLSHESKVELALKPVDLATGKKSPLDFLLWREGEDDEPGWSTEWGRGKPGWHIEDTAISITNFGAQYDIHGGAHELIYPHHEAEIAQAESLTGVSPFVRYWVHTGLLTTEGKKMSKSEGNVVRLRDVLDKYGADTLRFYIFQSHYRVDSIFDELELESAHQRLLDLREKISEEVSGVSYGQKGGLLPRDKLSVELLGPLLDDLNTPLLWRRVEHLSKSMGSLPQNKQVRAVLSLGLVSSITGVDFLGMESSNKGTESCTQLCK